MWLLLHFMAASGASILRFNNWIYFEKWLTRKLCKPTVFVDYTDIIVKPFWILSVNHPQQLEGKKLLLCQFCPASTTLAFKKKKIHFSSEPLIKASSLMQINCNVPKWYMKIISGKTQRLITKLIFWETSEGKLSCQHNT